MEKTIIVAEDAPSSRKMLSFTLSKEGYRIVEAEDGRDALEKLESSGADVLITDVHMPRMGGIELIEEVRKRSRYRKLPIIMLTSDSRDPVKNGGKNLGADAWIAKPYKAEQLVELVEKVLQRHPGS